MRSDAGRCEKKRVREYEGTISRKRRACWVRERGTVGLAVNWDMDGSSDR